MTYYLEIATLLEAFGMSDQCASVDVFAEKPTPESAMRWLNAALVELRMTSGDLADHMAKHSDYRDITSILRSIQRMISGEIRVSGEMITIVSMLIRQRTRLKLRHPSILWNINEYGAHWAKIDDWYVHITPQTRGRWILICRHGSDPKDYSPPFGRWLDSLDEAKEKALSCIEEGMNDEATFKIRKNTLS